MKKITLLINLIGLVMAIIAVGWAIQDSPKDSPPTACLIHNAPVSAACVHYGRECKYEDGNTDGKPCWWVNEGNVWYIDSSEYRNEN